VTVLLFGVAPAVIASRVDPIRGLRETNRATRRTGLRAGLAALQLTLSLTLLVSAGLLAGTMWRLQSLELGLDADDVVTLRLEPYGILRDDARTDVVLRETRDRLAAGRSIEVSH
jgi:putative ABC transport system permease protein